MTLEERSLRVIVRAPNWLGDLIMALPALTAIRAHFRDSVVTVAAPAAITPLLRVSPGVGECMALTGSHSADMRAMAGGRFDTGILLPNSFRSAWTFRRAGIPERWGFRSDLRGCLLTRAVPRPSRREGVLHQSMYYARLVERLGMAPPAGAVRVEVTPRVQSKARAVLELGDVDPDGLLVGFAPGAAYGHAKRWPPERFAELIRATGREHGASAVLVGSMADRHAAAEIESRLAERPAGAWPDAISPVRVANLVGQTDLPTFMGVMSYCRAFVSNDSGAMHVAAVLGVPVIGLFGPTDERATAPLGPHHALSHQVWCRPCHLRECPIDHRCMKRITVDRVFESLGALLDRRLT